MPKTPRGDRRGRVKFMLDTNIVSFLLRNNESVKAHFQLYEPHNIALSSITQAELLYGLAKRPDATRLHNAVHVLLASFNILPWHTDIAGHYGQLRAELESKGISLSDLDMLIAAHAASEKLTLVTNDKTFAKIANLKTVDWTIHPRPDND